jgi:hypothetical protein
MSDWAYIRDDLGDKVVDGLVASVTNTREDLALYRASLPGFAYEHSPRGLANWVNDRLWQHVQRELFDVSDVFFHEQGATREVVIGTRYRLRLKRHSPAGAIRNYRTSTALAFWELDSFALPGLEETRLCFGYVWDAEMEQISDPVMSRRSDQDTLLWMERLDEDAAAGGATDVTPIVPPSTPDLPRIDLPAADEKDGTDTP